VEQRPQICNSILELAWTDRKTRTLKIQGCGIRVHRPCESTLPVHKPDMSAWTGFVFEPIDDRVQLVFSVDNMNAKVSGRESLNGAAEPGRDLLEIDVFDGTKSV